MCGGVTPQGHGVEQTHHSSWQSIISQTDFCYSRSYLHGRSPLPLDPDADVIYSLSPLPSLSAFCPIRSPPRRKQLVSGQTSKRADVYVYTCGVLSCSVCWCSVATSAVIVTACRCRHRLCNLRRRGRRRLLVEAAASTPVGRYVSDREGLLIEEDGQFYIRTLPFMPALPPSLQTRLLRARPQHGYTQ